MGAREFLKDSLFLLCCLSLVGCGDAGNSLPAARQTARLACDLTVSIPTTAELSVAQLRIFYDDAPGGFGPPDTLAECVSLHPDSTFFRGVVNCDDDCSVGEGRVVQIQIGRGVSGDSLGLQTPSPIARCRFFATSEVDRGAFRVEIPDAGSATGGAADVTVSLDAVDCRPMDQETSSTTTTTESCAGTVCEAGEECLGGACEHTGLYHLDFEVSETVGALVGALQYLVEFDPALGAFERAPGLPNARCDLARHINGFHSAGTDDGELRVGIISGTGFSLPGPVASCRFRAEGRAPEADDFTITTEDSSQPNIVAIEPRPQVLIGAVR